MSAQNPWFDDPEWDNLRKKTSKKRGQQRPPAISQPKSSEEVFAKKVKPTSEQQVDAFDIPRDNRPVQVSIQLSLPSVDTFSPVLTHVKRLKRINSIQLKIASAVVLFGLGGFLAFNYGSNYIQKKDAGSQVLSDKTEAPAFDVSKPAATSSDSVKYDPSKQVASYSDTLNDTTIVVSQQPLPENFKENPFVELEKLATSFNASESFAVKDFKVYIGVSTKGPQSLILIKDKKLIFIQSQTKIPNTDWVTYIETLKT